MGSSIKMVVCDLDGTLLKHPKKISERNKKAIRVMRKKGVLFGVCSGRSAIALQKKLKTWGIDKDVDFVLGFNGAMYWDPATDEVQAAYALNAEDIPPILEVCKGYPFSFSQYEGLKMLSTKKNFLTSAMAGRNELEFVTVPIEELKKRTYKFMAVGMPWTLSKWLKSGRKDELKSARVFRSGPFLLEFVNPHLSKLEGVRMVAKKYGIKLDEIAAFGNDNNDLEMIEGTVGVAMSNALPAVKEKASYITDSNWKDGVATWVEQYVLADNPPKPVMKYKDKYLAETTAATTTEAVKPADAAAPAASRAV